MQCIMANLFEMTARIAVCIMTANTLGAMTAVWQINFTNEPEPHVFKVAGHRGLGMAYSKCVGRPTVSLSVNIHISIGYYLNFIIKFIFCLVYFKVKVLTLFPIISCSREHYQVLLPSTFSILRFFFFFFFLKNKKVKDFAGQMWQRGIIKWFL